ncbi:RidA family protein [Hymenobacter persicinus]|uniref:RidA family protein n=1 Tax=Hymenobacter persicinus TaxID=2025506 RepID=A0A4V1ZAG7_9BACT|nr:RidA family protein [Hymenobacter persicinus]RYU78047.1 RidA family protein [Hymenobacter persicinus]
MRQNISSDSEWETQVGYSRAVRVGNVVEVAGTTAPGADAYEQTRRALEKIEVALRAAGATFPDVVRTRMYVTDISQWPAVGRAHAEVFGAVRPAATMVQVAALIEASLLVEIEVTAIVSPPENA